MGLWIYRVSSKSDSVSKSVHCFCCRPAEGWPSRPVNRLQKESWWLTAWKPQNGQHSAITFAALPVYTTAHTLSRLLPARRAAAMRAYLTVMVSATNNGQSFSADSTFRRVVWGAKYTSDVILAQQLVQPRIKTRFFVGQNTGIASKLSWWA